MSTSRAVIVTMLGAILSRAARRPLSLGTILYLFAIPSTPDDHGKNVASAGRSSSLLAVASSKYLVFLVAGCKISLIILSLVLFM